MLEQFCDIERERQLLYGLLQAPVAALSILQGLSPKDFYLTDHQKLYSAAQLLLRKEESFDAVSVQREYERTKGSPQALHDIQDTLVTAREQLQIAHRVVGKLAKVRRLHTALQEGISKLKEGAEPGDVLEHISQANPSEELESALWLNESVAQTYENLEQLSQQKQSPGLSTGIRDMDAGNHRLYPGNLVYLAARPGVGKTAFALQISEACAKSGHSVAFFSMEMTADELSQRMLARQSGVSLSKLLHPNRIIQSEWERLSLGAAELDLPMKLFECPELSIDRIQVVLAQSQPSRKPFSMVVVDYLQLMDGPHQREYDRITYLSKSFKRLAMRYKIPFLVLSQLSRANESRADKRPSLSDLRGSGGMEQDGNAVWFLHREELYDPDAMAGDTEIIVGKSRHSQPGTIRCIYNGSTTSFNNRL